MSRKKSVFDRLKFPPNLSTSNHVVPIASVFDRLKFPNSVENGSTSIQPDHNVSLGQSYARAVSKSVVNPPVNSPLKPGQLIYQPINNQRNSGDLVSDSRGKEFCFKKREHVLPGFLPFFKFKSFDGPDLSAWPAASFLSWFNAHGPGLQPVTASSFKEIFSSPLKVISPSWAYEIPTNLCEGTTPEKVFKGFFQRTI
jgi:hypothetical protein